MALALCLEIKLWKKRRDPAMIVMKIVEKMLYLFVPVKNVFLYLSSSALYSLNRIMFSKIVANVVSPGS